MKNFKDNGFKKDRKDFGGRPTFGGDKRSGGGKFGGGQGRSDQRGERSEMFTATCSECHKSCEVPFRPSGDKPVYCTACFGKRNEHAPRTEHGGGFGNERRVSSFHGERPQYARPSRDDRAPQSTSRGLESGEIAEVKQRLTMIETRLTRIFDLLKQTVAPVVREEVLDLPEVALVPKKERKSKTKKVKVAAPKKVAKKSVKKAGKKVAK